jgi:hypothetical protein
MIVTIYCNIPTDHISSWQCVEVDIIHQPVLWVSITWDLYKQEDYDASWLNNIKEKEMTKTTEKKVKHEKKVSQK